MSNRNPIIAFYSRSAYPASNVLKYSENYKNTNVNTLIISGPNGYEGGIVYNDPPFPMFNSTGEYVGDPQWPDSLRQLVSETNIGATNVYFSLSNSAISALAAMSATNLASVMTWLKNNGLTGIDMDCESWGQPGGLPPMAPACQTVTLAAITAGLALTAAPYNRTEEWQHWCAFVAENKGSLSWLNIQCYSGGASNDPVQWYNGFSPPVPIVAGFEASPGTDPGSLTPAQALTQLKAWQGESPANCLAGAFVWDFGLTVSGTYTVGEFALAMYNGLTGNANTITVSACDNELSIVAFQGNASYEVARIMSGYSNPVSVTINVAAGENNGAIVLNGVTQALNATVTACVPSFAYSLAFIGINWGGPTQFTVNVNGTALALPYNPEGATGVVWTPAPVAITV